MVTPDLTVSALHCASRLPCLARRLLVLDRHQFLLPPSAKFSAFAHADALLTEGKVLRGRPHDQRSIDSSVDKLWCAYNAGQRSQFKILRACSRSYSPSVYLPNYNLIAILCVSINQSINPAEIKAT